MARFKPDGYERLFSEPWTEVYHKCSIPLPPHSSDVYKIIHQITDGMHQLIVEGQRNRQYSQEKSLEETPLMSRDQIRS